MWAVYGSVTGRWLVQVWLGDVSIGQMLQGFWLILLSDTYLYAALERKVY